MKRYVAGLALAITMLALAACSSSAAPATGDPGVSSPPADPNAVTVVADQLAFDTAELVVPADEDFSLVFDNREGPPHNVAIYTDESASQSIYVGEIFSGPATKTYTVPAMAAGTYFFRCDVHPDMKGTVVAK